MRHKTYIYLYLFSDLHIELGISWSWALIITKHGPEWYAVWSWMVNSSFCCEIFWHYGSLESGKTIVGKVKPLWEKEKMLVTSIFSFSHNVLKSPLYFTVVKSQVRLEMR